MSNFSVVRKSCVVIGPLSSRFKRMGALLSPPVVCGAIVGIGVMKCFAASAIAYLSFEGGGKGGVQQ